MVRIVAASCDGTKDKDPTFHAMRRVTVLVFPDFQILDATGPIAAFKIAERHAPGSYELQAVAVAPGLVRSSSGARLQACSVQGLRGIDTLLVAGGDGADLAARCTSTRRFVQRTAQTARRVASVCSGAYVLAQAGLLDGLPETTHWSRTPDFARRFPQVRLDADKIFIRAGRIWTSAGITAGIDMALAMIAEDLGESTARTTARQLVVYYRRPGGQSQFSALLDMGRQSGRFGALFDHIRSNLHERLAVDDLAERCHLSPRQFSRLFRAEVELVAGAGGGVAAHRGGEGRARKPRAVDPAGRHRVRLRQPGAHAPQFRAPHRRRARGRTTQCPLASARHQVIVQMAIPAGIRTARR